MSSEIRSTDPLSCIQVALSNRIPWVWRMGVLRVYPSPLEKILRLDPQQNFFLTPTLKFQLDSSTEIFGQGLLVPETLHRTVLIWTNKVKNTQKQILYQLFEFKVFRCRNLKAISISILCCSLSRKTMSGKMQLANLFSLKKIMVS